MPSAATQPEDAMEVVASEEVWEETENDELVFDHIRVIVRQGSRYLFARQKDRYAPAQGVRDGVAHLHLLGLVHNDLNPSNIMVEDDAAIIIDFDSCRQRGEPMGVKGPTAGWGTYTEYATPESDISNLDQIERYLLG
ncbi:hypothetical protein B0T19DRAFT_416741 [Cercophora scortea]|uniref:Protein kinase domain-containing protein n=1 Tax=Cercophora scortea TaxID=314031 RepID=A0AAE0IXA5_9PEZI|nr:hypothetical protein B0T19DRAFT_416741 [Cercophora scortea]